MRIDSRFSSAPLTGASSTRGSSGQRFSLDGAAGGAKSSATAAAAPLTSLDALIAVQAEGDVTERRRRSVLRGRNLLDALDQLKAGLLSGKVSGFQLQRLGKELGAQRQASGDPELDELIGHIELRAQVELAKLGRA
jgi:Class II flagellar assembly regulator